MKQTITLKAVLPKENISNAYNYAREKETVETQTVIAFYKGELREIVNARWYMARKSDGASPVYCSIWVNGWHGKKATVTGKGTAGGYGYHKPSQALESAISSAGIKLYGVTHWDRYDYTNKRAFTQEEINATLKAAMKKECHIGGVGEDAAKQALLAIARTVVGNRAILTIV
jgi:hypothetical protein